MVRDAAWQTLAEPRRRRLVRLCSQRPRGVNELHRAMPDVTLGAISQHLARLREAGVLAVEQTGRNRVYRVESGALRSLHADLDEMWAVSLHRLSRLAEAKEARKR